MDRCRHAWNSLQEKYEFRAPAPEGAIDSAPLAVCLKAYPDTNLLITSLLPELMQIFSNHQSSNRE
jgi:hypothetical protein